MHPRQSISLATIVLLAACGGDAPPAPETGPDAAVSAASASETGRLNDFLERAFDRRLARSPELQSYIGIKDDYGKWDENTEAHAAEGLAIAREELETLGGFDVDALDEQARLSHRLYEYELRRGIESHEFRHHVYESTQMSGLQSQIPSFLINIHRVASVADAEAYISRLRGVEKVVEQAIEQMEIRADKGVVPPRFVFPYMIEDVRNVLTGAPFDDSGEQSTLAADFREKIAALDVEAAGKKRLVEAADAALAGEFAAGFRRLLEYYPALAERATDDDGAWKLPQGAAFYDHRLEVMTTTELGPEEIHDIGLAEVARIHEEMRGIMREVEFDGDLDAFFEFMRSDPRFYYPNTEEGRERYLREARAAIEAMRARLDELFGLKPEAEMIVKAVEPFREKSAGKAFYQQPAADGSRPGIYYANLHDMSDMPIYQLEALAYHEGLPGHHMQVALAQELEAIPRFRRYGRYTAYSEGWGLYAERIPKEIGFYTDPYSDFGRLAMELWRAARLVVDTGIHDMRWTREQAIEYLLENTPNPRGDAVKAIERYIVWPGQATAYKIGMLRLLELRERAREALGDAFDIRDFHDVVLGDGPMPLSVLEERIEAYIEAHRTAAAGAGLDAPRGGMDTRPTMNAGIAAARAWWPHPLTERAAG